MVHTERDLHMPFQKPRKRIAGGAGKSATNQGQSAYAQILESVSLFGVDVVVGKSESDRYWSLSLVSSLDGSRKVVARLPQRNAQLLADVLTAVAVAAPTHNPNRETVEALKRSLRSALVTTSANGK